MNFVKSSNIYCRRTDANDIQMKNLFDYATKELSQDAFLRWLFENYDDAEAGIAASRLLGKLCSFQQGEKIESLETQAQWCRIDISVWMTTSFGRKIALFIEDKTFSDEHSQLTVYDGHIDKIKDREVYKVFYKTDLLNDEEKGRIAAANANNDVDWVQFGIEDIFSFFSEYKSSDIMILAQYSQHIEKIYKAVKNTEKPQKSENIIDLLKWKAYFGNVIIPALKKSKRSSEFEAYTWRAGQYPYVVLYIKKAGYGGRKIPYLEIRSRDCQDNKFKAKILCYDIDIKDIPQQNVLIENIKAIRGLECKYLRKNKNGDENYFPKQVGFSRQDLMATTDGEFIALVEKYIDCYLQAMKDWK